MNRLFSTVAAPSYLGSDSNVSPLSSHPHQHLLLPIFFIITILVVVKWYFFLVLTNDVRHLFSCLLAICMTYLEEYQF
jgi:hypothetical protein